MSLEDLFGPGGALAEALPGHEVRPSQREMAEAVAQALEEGRSLAVEAGTGVGKSLAYLLPAAAWAARGGRRVLVSTHTRALQEQLCQRELPTAGRVLARLGLPLRWAMLMGSENYLCVQRLERAAAGSPKDALSGLRLWALTAPGGLRSTLPDPVADALWRRINRAPDACAGPAGPYWDRCLWRRDRERAEGAQVLVVNHALLLSGARLPPFDAMILDEAHNLEEAASARYGLSVDLPRAFALSEEAREAARRLGEEALERTAGRAPAALARLLEDLARRAGLEGPDEESPGRLLEGEAGPLPPELAELERALAAAAAAREASPEGSELRALHARAAGLSAELAQLLSGEGPGEQARWASWTREGPQLRSAPLDPGRRLAEGLFSRGVPAVLASATLADPEEGLKGFKDRVGLPEARTLSLPSPYDYPSQAALWCVPGLPDPDDEEAHARAVAKACEEVVSAVPGGVFLLFSSWRLLRKVHADLRRRIEGRPVWAQGAAGSEELLERFAEAGDAVLLGVDTFWQGVDVPGPALSCVVLVKLPFPNFAAPLELARRRWMADNGRDYFRDWSLPKAVMKFRQGFGRLIRGSRDRGAVVCLDPRLTTRGYRKFFLEALPPCRRLGSLEELRAFFREPAVPSNEA